jgi:hypothetical protein
MATENRAIFEDRQKLMMVYVAIIAFTFGVLICSYLPDFMVEHTFHWYAYVSVKPQMAEYNLFLSDIAKFCSRNDGREIRPYIVHTLTETKLYCLDG